MPQQMLMYRAASWFIRAYAPELATRMQTTEELQDIIDLTKDDYEVRVADEIKQNANSEVIDIEAPDEPEAPKEQTETALTNNDPGF